MAKRKKKPKLPKIKRCPWPKCNGKGELISGTWHCVICGKCNNNGPHGDTPEEGINYWNERQ